MTPIVSLSRFTGLALAAAVAWVPLAAPVHVHESRGHGHHRAVIHRHSQAHGGGHDGPNHHGVFERHDEAQVRTLSSVFIVPNAPWVPSPLPLQAAQVIEEPIIQAAHPIADFVELVIHGPPRAPALFRGPPVSPAL